MPWFPLLPTVAVPQRSLEGRAWGQEVAHSPWWGKLCGTVWVSCRGWAGHSLAGSWTAGAGKLGQKGGQGQNAREGWNQWDLLLRVILSVFIKTYWWFNLFYKYTFKGEPQWVECFNLSQFYSPTAQVSWTSPPSFLPRQMTRGKLLIFSLCRQSNTSNFLRVQLQGRATSNSFEPSHQLRCATDMKSSWLPLQRPTCLLLETLQSCPWDNWAFHLPDTQITH